MNRSAERSARPSPAEPAEHCVFCGHPLAFGEARCPACGEKAAPGERKLVSLLFADLAGYTAMAASMDPEDVYQFIRPTMTSLRLIVEGFGGTVPQVLGDGFMAVFGVPTAHEDDAERAVRAAFAVIDHVRQLNAGREGPLLPPVHAGINTGEVMVAGSHEPSGFAIVGDAVNMAARFAAIAPGDRVFAGERTQAMSLHAIRYGPPTLRRVKGKSGLVTIYEAVGVHSTVPVGHVAPGRPTRFVGRGDVLRRLRGEQQAARETNRSRVLVVVGDPGLGKSRLATEFRAGLSPVRSLLGRCPPYGQRYPLYPFMEALRELAGVPPEAGPKRTERGIVALSRAMARGQDHEGLAASLRFLLAADGRTGAVAAEPGEETRHAVRSVLEAAARSEPLVIVLDDLHWADPDLLDVLTEIHESPTAGALLVMGLARPDLATRAHDLPMIELSALGEDDIRQMIESTLGHGVPGEVAQRLVERSGGNPLYLEESARMLVEAGALEKSNGVWTLARPETLEGVPTTLRLLIAARIDGLDPQEKQVLQDAAVAGEVTWDRLAERLHGRRTTAILGRLCGRDLLHRSARSQVPGAREYQFKHVLIRDVAYGSLPRAARASRHIQIAEWYEEQLKTLPQEPLAELGHHYEQAWHLSKSTTQPRPPPELARQAVEHLGRWGARVFAYQPRLAEAAYRRALAIAQAEPDIGGSLLGALRRGRAEGLIELGRHQEAIDEATRARELAARAHDRSLRAGALLALGRAESYLGNVCQARRLLAMALQLFEAEGDLSGQARTLVCMATACRFDDFPREVELYRQALDSFARSGDRRERAMVAQDLAYLLTVAGGKEFLQPYALARSLARSEGDLRSRGALERTWGYAAFYRGLMDDALKAARRARPLAREAGDRWVEVDALLLEAQVTGANGLPDEAERLVSELMSIADRAKARHLKALAQLAGARPALRRGNPALARRRLQSARGILRRLGVDAEMAEVDLVDAAVSMERGSWRRCLPLADLAEDRSRRNGWRLFEAEAPLIRGRALLAAGRVQQAEEELARAIELATTADAPGLLALARASHLQCRILGGRPGRVRSPGASSREIEAITAENRGLMALLDGRPDEAAAAFEEAVARWEELGTTIWLARSLELQGRALDAAGSRRAAAAAVRRSEKVRLVLRPTTSGRSAARVATSGARPRAAVRR